MIPKIKKIEAYAIDNGAIFGSVVEAEEAQLCLEISKALNEEKIRNDTYGVLNERDFIKWVRNHKKLVRCILGEEK